MKRFDGSRFFLQKMWPLCLAILFVAAGLGLTLLYGSSRFNQNVTNGEPGYTGVSMGADGFSQRVLGNDYPLKEAIFRVSSMDLNPDAVLVVDLYLRADNDSEGTLLSRQTRTVAQLQERNAVVLEYDSIKLTYKRDYYFKFYFENYQYGDLSLVVANTGEAPYYETAYTADGEQIEGAIYYQLVMGHGKDYKLFPWTLAMVFFAIPLLVTLLSGKTFWKSLLWTVLGISLLLYVMGMLALLPYVSVVVLAAGIACALLSGYLLSVSERARENMPGSNWLQMIAFAIALVIVYVQTYKLPVHYQDEFNHWTLAVENLYLFGKMHIHAQSTVRLFRYPPLTSLFEYLMLCLYGKYSEGIVVFGLKAFLLPALFALLDYKKAGKKSLVFYIFAIGMALLLPELWIDREFTNTICTDIAAGLFTSLILVEGYQFIKEPKKQKGIYILLLTLLQILIKDNSMILLFSCYGGLLLLLLVSGIIYRNKTEKTIFIRQTLRRNAWAALGYSFLGFLLGRGSWTLWSQLLASGMKDTTFRYIFLVTVVAVLVLWMVCKKCILAPFQKKISGWTPEKAARGKRWLLLGILSLCILVILFVAVILLGKGYLNTSNEDLSAVAISGLSMESILRYLSGNGQTYQYQIIPLHIHKLFFQTVYETNVFNMSYFGSVLLLLFVFGIALQMRKDHTSEEFAGSSIFMVGAAVICAFIYHIVYTFTLEDFEALTFAAEERYLGSMLLALTGFVLYLIGRWSDEWSITQINLWLTGLLMGVLVMTTGGIEMLYGINTPERYESEDTPIAENLRKVVRETDRIYYAPTVATAYDMPQYRYVAAPVVVDVGADASMPEAIPDTYTFFTIGYDYLFVQQIDDSFRRNYQNLISEDLELVDYSLYRICPTEDGNLKLEYYQTLAGK